MKLICTAVDHGQRHINLSSHGWSKIVAAVESKRLRQPKSLFELRDAEGIKPGSTITVSLGGRLYTGVVTWETEVILESFQLTAVIYAGRAPPRTDNKAART